MCCCCCCDCLLVIISIFFPPLPVIVKRGLCSCDLLINICLCILGYIPGLIHSWYIIAKYPDIEYVVFDEEQRIQSTYPPTTAYMAQQQHQQQPQPQQQPYFPPQHRGTYFDHPEPFKTSGQQHHTNVLDGPLSPLSRDPMTAPPSSNSNTGSSSGNNNSNYGSIMGASASGNADDGDDEQQPVEAPPSYENVMNETSKQFR